MRVLPSHMTEQKQAYKPAVRQMQPGSLYDLSAVGVPLLLAQQLIFVHLPPTALSNIRRALLPLVRHDNLHFDLVGGEKPAWRAAAYSAVATDLCKLLLTLGTNHVFLSNKKAAASDPMYQRTIYCWNLDEVAEKKIAEGSEQNP